MSNQQHIIKHLTWQIEGASNSNSDRIMKDIETFNWEVFVHRFAELADHLTPKDKLVYVPDLEIELEIKDLELDRKFTEQLLEALSGAIKKHQFQSIHETQDELLKAELPSILHNTNEQNDKITRLIKSENRDWQVFEYFLINGIIPWWSDINLQMLEEKLSSLISNGESISFSNQLKFTASILQRFSYQFSLSFIGKTWKCIQRNGFQELVEQFGIYIEHVIEGIDLKNKQEILLRLKTSQLFLHWHPDFNKHDRQVEMLATVLSFIIPPEKNITTKLIPELKSDLKKTRIKSFPQVIQQSIKDYLNIPYDLKKGKPNVQSDRANRLKTSKSSLTTEDKERTIELNNPSLRSERDLKTESDFATLQHEEGIYGNHLGLVILHPFLEIFFKDCNLLTEKKSFKSADTQQLAIHLLYYASSGQLNPSEEELPLIKILCGHILEDTIAKKITINAKYKSKTNQLLKAIVQHWKALKSTNIEALQESFLQRPGKMQKKESAWEITVEQKSIDILLTRLPWGISPVYLPWNPYPIHVNWT